MVHELARDGKPDSVTTLGKASSAIKPNPDPQFPSNLLPGDLVPEYHYHLAKGVPR
jgi:hypothetical protein